MFTVLDIVTGNEMPLGQLQARLGRSAVSARVVRMSSVYVATADRSQASLVTKSNPSL